jgi:hypothetical protein
VVDPRPCEPSSFVCFLLMPLARTRHAPAEHPFPLRSAHMAVLQQAVYPPIPANFSAPPPPPLLSHMQLSHQQEPAFHQQHQAPPAPFGQDPLPQQHEHHHAHGQTHHVQHQNQELGAAVQSPLAAAVGHEPARQGRKVGSRSCPPVESNLDTLSCRVLQLLPKHAVRIVCLLKPTDFNLPMYSARRPHPRAASCRGWTLTYSLAQPSVRF